MKIFRLVTIMAVLCHQLSAFDWPGGTLQVPVVFRGEETFAGWVPSSPWGSSAFIQEPAVELRNDANQLIAVYPITGGTMDWYDGALRSGTASFSVPAGTYFLTTRQGLRHVRISGEGWSGFRLVLDSITEPAPPNAPPTVAWTSAPPGAEHLQSYIVSAHGSDADGNLTQVNVWKNGQPFALGGAGTGYEADYSNGTSDAGPQTVTFTAQAVDAAGATSPIISHTVTIAAAPAQFSLTTLAGAGGTVSAGGTFTSGSWATIIASPDSVHDFAGWSGDAGGAANPLTVVMDRDKSVQAIFTLKSFALFTSATAGGAVTQGGTYPPGTTVTVSAVPDALHRFVGWAGDAGGTSATVTVLLDGPKSVQAVFTDKTSQTLTFPAPADQPVSGPPLTLNATASSGLPVSYTVLSGPAVLNGNQLQITGPGDVTVEARQAGDGFYLPAAPVIRTFNTFAVAVLRYRPSGRTILQSRSANSAAPYVLETP